jgi:hypothetical protein
MVFPRNAEGEQNVSRSFLLVGAILCLTAACRAQSLQDHMVSVHSDAYVCCPLSIVDHVRGTGICLNPGCSVIVTPVHLQMLAGQTSLTVGRGKTAKISSLATDNDAGKTGMNITGSKRTLSLKLANDIAFIYKDMPVRHKAAATYSDEAQVGQTIVVAGYFGGRLNDRFQTRNAHIIGTDLAVAFGGNIIKENLIVDVSLDADLSGSGVFDEQGNVLGMIIFEGLLKSDHGNLKVAVALPVKTIARALGQLDPTLGSRIFATIPENALSEHTEVLELDTDVPGDLSSVIPHLSVLPLEMPNAVERLHAQSKAAHALMINLIATQCIASVDAKPLCDEVANASGEETFRRIGKDGELGEPTTMWRESPLSVWTDTDWIETINEVSEYPWVLQGSVGDEYLFSLKSEAEDERCHYHEVNRLGSPLFGGGPQAFDGSVACFQQVLTDNNLNVLAVFTEETPPPQCRVKGLQTAIYYQWTKLEGSTSLTLLPVRELVSAKVAGQEKLLYSEISWTGYKEFRTEHKVIFK